MSHTYRIENEKPSELEPHICESEEEFKEEKYIEEQYRTVDEMYARGEIGKDERDSLRHELDLQYNPDTAEEEEEEEMLEHMDDDWGETPETERERMDREYEEKCDALLDERFERDSDY